MQQQCLLFEKFRKHTVKIIHNDNDSEIAIKHFTMKQIIPLLILMFSGVLGGSFCAFTEQNNLLSLTFSGHYLCSQIHQNFIDSVISSFFSAMFMQTVVLMCGLSCIGVPLLLTVPILYGMAIGWISGRLYSLMGLRGLPVNLILFLLPEVIRSLALLILLIPAKECSAALFYTASSLRLENCKQRIRICFTCYFISALGIIIYALSGTLLYFLFGEYLIK